MTKVFSEDEFSRQINEDRTWRLKEISDLKSAARRADESLQRVLLRALVAVCYAHWEGYIRNSARRYLEYIAKRKYKFRELDRQFLRNNFLLRLNGLAGSKAGMAELCKLMDDILDADEQRFSRFKAELINTKSNLNFEVFSNVCRICAVPTISFENQNTFIDVVLLKRRNSIAHGEDTLVGLSDLDQVADGTIDLMREFGNLLENNIYLQSFKAQVLAVDLPA